MGSAIAVQRLLFLMCALLIPPLAMASPGTPVPTFPGTPSDTAYRVVRLSPTFTWTNVSGATSYGLYISKAPYGPSNIVYENQAISASATTFTLPAGTLEPDVKYRWDMVAFASGVQSAVSSNLYFQTPSAGALKLMSHASCGEFRWDLAEGIYAHLFAPPLRFQAQTLEADINNNYSNAMEVENATKLFKALFSTKEALELTPASDATKIMSSSLSSEGTILEIDGVSVIPTLSDALATVTSDSPVTAVVDGASNVATFVTNTFNAIQAYWYLSQLQPLVSLQSALGSYYRRYPQLE